MYSSTTRRTQALGGAVLIGLMLGIGCAGSASSDSQATSPTSGDAGKPGYDDGDSGNSPPPPVDAGCVAKPGSDLPDDSFEDSDCDGIDGSRDAAVFVASSGDDAAPGTIEQPVKTIGKAVALAAQAKKYVIVANGTYAEAIVVDGVAVSIYGGYQPMGWQRVSDRAAVSPGTGVPLTIKNVTSPMVVDRLSLTASDATDPGTSSYAMIVSNAQSATLTHLALTAGRGADGVTPSASAAYPQPAQAGANGQSLPTVACDKSRPMAQRAAACATIAARGSDGTLGNGAGGWGGQGYNHEVDQAYGHDGSPGSPSGFGGAGAVGSGEGGPGIDGQRGAGGTPATSGFGGVTSDGYLANNVGTAGASGSIGGSGGGGAGGFSACSPNDCSTTNFYFVGGGGGQGGYGGAGGIGAHAAGGGGASIGLFVFASNVTLTNSTITTTDGGRGGDAVIGGDGQAGGAAGLGGSGTAPQGVGYNGGAGGRGGSGGAGGAGGGGPSIAVLASGVAPTKQGVTVNVGAGGKGGKGAPGVGDGADGVSEEIHVVASSDAGADAGH